MNFLLPIAAGAFSFALVQFLWYAPFGFGTRFIRERGMTEEESIREAVEHPESQSRFWLGVVVPAFLSSAALVALKGITDRLVGTETGFFLFSLAMSLGVSLPKYLVAWFSGRKPEALMLIQDGALFFGLLATTFAIIFCTAS